MNKFITIAAAGVLASSVAMAGEKAAELPKFEELDANADGQITLNEVEGNEAVSKVFETIDADKSGGLSAEEYESVQKM